MCRSRVRSNGSNSAVNASVAADSGLLPKASASSEARGNSPISATLPGPAEEYSQRHRTVAGKILPAVARTDIAGAGSAEGVALPVRDRGERQRERTLLRPQQPAPAVVCNLGLVAHARAAEMGGEQRVGPQILIAGENDVDQKRVALHAGHDSQLSSKRSWR